MLVLVSGGAGFIGSNFLNMLVPLYHQYSFINIDKLTNSSNLLNLKKIEKLPNYEFVKASISDSSYIESLFNKYKPDLVVNFAAETHVDHSIARPSEFINSNIVGTFNLLEACRRHWEDKRGKLFLQVSTDEVYGSLSDEGYFDEKSCYDPRNPYSASKAAADHLVKAYYNTYGLPVKITNCSNNFGPYQFPEKLIPLIILNAIAQKPLPVYGKGLNIRDWIFVEDHCRAIWLVIEKGKVGEKYNIGGGNEWKNIDIVNKICEMLAEEEGESKNYYKKLITFTEDRPGHDYRYAINYSKITNELGWVPQESFETGLRKTIKWYLTNQSWINKYGSS